MVVAAASGEESVRSSVNAAGRSGRAAGIDLRICYASGFGVIADESVVGGAPVEIVDSADNIAASRCRVPDRCYGGGACQCGIEIKATIADQGTFAERSIERVVSAEDITGLLRLHCRRSC